MALKTDAQMLRDAFRRCHTDPAWRALFIANARQPFVGEQQEPPEAQAEYTLVDIDTNLIIDSYPDLQAAKERAVAERLHAWEILGADDKVVAWKIPL